MSPNLAAPPKNADNCVYFLRDDLGINLPSGLTSFPDKTAHINVLLSQTPRQGDVAVISTSNDPNGHVAEVTNVTANSITILEANYHKDPAMGQGIVDSRISTASNLAQAEQQLNIVGFIRP
jgi:hypothetical protein